MCRTCNSAISHWRQSNQGFKASKIVKLITKIQFWMKIKNLLLDINNYKFEHISNIYWNFEHNITVTCLYVLYGCCSIIFLFIVFDSKIVYLKPNVYQVFWIQPLLKKSIFFFLYFQFDFFLFCSWFDYNLLFYNFTVLFNFWKQMFSFCSNSVWNMYCSYCIYYFSTVYAAIHLKFFIF